MGLTDGIAWEKEYGYEPKRKSHALEPTDMMEMAMSLVCVLPKKQVKEILLGEQYSKEDINEFIEKCES